MGGMRDRAASWLSFRTFRSQATPADTGRDSPAGREKFPTLPAGANEGFVGANEKDSPPARSSDEQDAGGRRASSEVRDPRSAVRVVPPWAHAEDDSDEAEDDESPDAADPSSTLLPQAPASTQLAQHNHTPHPKAPASSSPPIAAAPSSPKTGPPPPLSPTTLRSHHATSGAAMPSSRWVAFIETSGSAPSGSPVERVPADWLATHGPDYSQPWQPRDPHDAEKGGASRWGRRRRSLWERWRHTLVRNPMVPFTIRLIVLSFSLIALGLGARIYLDGNFAAQPAWSMAIDTQTSPLMAIIVDAVAPPYLVYVTYDEYRGKPLGLRSATAKLRLVLLDLLFIVFDAANLSLAFESARATALRNDQLMLMDQGAAYDERLQWALACVLLIALLAWLMTFAISLLRLVARVER